MKKRLFAIALSLCMTLSLLPTAAFAAENGESGTTVTQSGGVQSETIAAAIQAGDSYTLTGDMTESVTIPQGKTFTLNLGGYTLTNETNKHTITVEKGATLTIEGTGTVDNVSHGRGALVNLGTTTLNGGMFTRSKEAGKYSPYGNGGNSWYTIDNGGTLTINKGVSVDNKGGYSSMIRNGADSNRKGSTLIINGGTFDGGINTVKNDEYGVLTINGGEFTNTAQFVIMNWNEATIKGGNFQTKDTAQAVLFTAKYAEEGAVGKLTIHNGTFEKASDKQELICNHYDENGKVLYTGTAVITGGTFSADPSAYLADAYGMFKTSDGKYGVGQPVKITFDYDGFTPTMDTEENYTWEVYTSHSLRDCGYTVFPVFTKDGYRQSNTWKYSDGTVASLNDVVTGAVTLTPVAGEQIEYKIGYLDETKNALTEESIKNLAGVKHMGDEVTFQVVAKDGYTAHAYTTCYGKKTELVLDKELKGSFTMPDGNVDLIIEYIKDIVIDDDVADLVEDVEISAGKTNVATPDVKADTTEDEKNVMDSATNTLGQTEVVGEAALVNAANNSIDEGTLDVNKAITAKKDEIQAAVNAANEGKGENEQVAATVTVTPYLEIKVTDAKVEGNAKSVTMDVTPKVVIKAEVQGQNAIDLGTKDLTVTDPIEMTLPVPITLGTGEIFVQHKGYEYTTERTNNNEVTFINPHGFSEFTVNSASQSVTSITKDGNTTRYVDLGLAIDEADAGTTLYVTSRAHGKSYTTGKGGKTVTLTKSSELGDFEVTINGTKYTLTSAGVSITTPRASSGGGGSASTGYTVTAPSAKNGSVSVTPKNASKGDTVTVTVKADKGYELSKLTVTDKNGKTVKLTDKGNGKYTFTMPGSKVEVKAEFVETVTEPENPFRDVNKNAYYYKQVLWAVEKGITSGVSANEFAPEAACTRGQMVTFLWKAAGSPEVSGALAFDDVSSDAYYAKAVRWAAQQGITSGTSAGVFSPDAPCTRGQMAMFLYAYAKTPAVTGSVPFGDVASGDYFNTAVLWAVNNGITSGTSSTTYSPASVCTRGQMVVFLYQLLNK